MEASLRGALGEVTSRAREYLHVREYPKPGLSLSARDEHARSQRNRCILTCGRRSHDPREKKHAVEAYPIQKRKIASAIPARNSSGRAFTACGCAMGIAASLMPATVHAQEYPWCLSREGYLYCFYQTQQQCQWTATGIGGCALNPRLLFPNKPRDSNASLVGPKSR